MVYDDRMNGNEIKCIVIMKSNIIINSINKFHMNPSGNIISNLTVIGHGIWMYIFC